LGTLRAVSLAEAIVAIFLIVSAVMVSTSLFHSGLRYTRMTQTRAMAGMYGRKVMQEIRSWARQPANYDSDWSTYQGAELVDPDYPGFVARVACLAAGREALSPSLGLEEMYGARAYRLPRASVPVRVNVAWGQPEQTLTLMSLVGEPERELDEDPTVVIQRVSGPAGPVPPRAEVGFTAQLRDSNGDPIPGIRFSWSLLPVTGNATLLKGSLPRDGSAMTLKHEYEWNPLMSPPQVGPISGEVRLEAVCRYRGRRIVNAAPVVVFLQ
jgi:Tfp pilus assembly protein PilV